MKKVLLLIILLTSLASMAYSKEGWHFEAIAEQYPAINSIFNIREPWVYTNIGLYKGYAVMPRPMHGFALYKDNEWSFYTPDIIKANLINKEAIDSIDMKQINMYFSCSDNKGNLWLAADNSVYRFNSEGFYCHYSFKTKSGSRIKPYNILRLTQYGDALYCQMQYADYTKPEIIPRIDIYKYDYDTNNFIEFATDTMSVSFKSPTKVLIDSKGNQYALKNFPITNYTYYHIELRESDTLVFLKQGLVIDKYYDNNLICRDSIIYQLELERKSSFGVEKYPLNNVAINSTSDLANNTYYLQTYEREKKDGKMIQHESRIYKYSSQGNASFIDIPFLPGDSTYYKPNDFAVDADGNITVVYFGKGIYCYTPTSSVEQTEQLLPGAWIWKLYPNPATERARIEFHLSRDARSNAQITISDIRGTAIKDISSEIEYDDARQEAIIDFSVADIPSGNYYILISAGNSKKLKRFIVNR